MSPGGSEWASPLMVVRKPNGNLRIYEDKQSGHQSENCSDSYPISRVESAFTYLADMKMFAKIDLASAYHQIALDEASIEITTVNTPLDCYVEPGSHLALKLPAHYFKRLSKRIFADKPVSNIIVYQDDVYIGVMDKRLKYKSSLYIKKS